MRKYQKILNDKENSRSEYAALRRCHSKFTISRHKRVFEFMEMVAISQLKHVQPSHALEIVRQVDREQWPAVTKECEQEQWTVMELREQFGHNGNGTRPDPPPTREWDALFTGMRKHLVGVQRLKSNPRRDEAWHRLVEMADIKLKEICDADCNTGKGRAWSMP